MIWTAKHESQDVLALGAFVEVVCAEVLIEGAIFEHVVSGSESGSGDSTDGPQLRAHSHQEMNDLCAR